jgi:hypothetical protein
MVLGIGTAARVDELEIQWARRQSGTRKDPNPPLIRYVRIVQGKGIVST